MEWNNIKVGEHIIQSDYDILFFNNQYVQAMRIWGWDWVIERLRPRV